MQIRSIAAFVGVLLLASACADSSLAAPEPSLRFSALPGNDTTGLRERFEPLAAHLSEALEVPVEYHPTSTYAASVEAFKNGDVQLAWFDGLTGAQARAAVDGARAIARGKVDPCDKSYLVAHAGTGLEQGDEFPLALAGLSFTFGPADSTAGRLMPEHYVRAHTGRSPEAFFGAPNSYADSAGEVAALVAAGTYQAGAIDSKTYDDMVAEGKLDPQVCRVIWVTPDFPDHSWTVRPELDLEFGAGFTDRLQAALVAIQDPALLAAVARPEGLVEAANEDFRPLAELARELGLL